MTTYRRLIGVVCGLGVLACVLACGSFSKGMDLGMIAAAYEEYEKANKRPPASADELSQWASTNLSNTVNAINKTKAGGDYVVKWGTKMGDPNKILAYEKDAAANGGIVMMADKTVKNPTSKAEFDALNK